MTTLNSQSQSGTSFSANGVNAVQNDLRLNGVDDNMEFYGGFGTITIQPSASVLPVPDALLEFKLEEGNYSAQFGHSTGSVVDAVIKSGTNTYKGALWEYLRNTDFNANDWFANHNGIPRPSYHENQFGGTIGGPVRLPFHRRGVKNTFWFFDAQRLIISAPSYYTETVPTDGMVNSGFHDLSDLIRYNSGSNTDVLGRVFPTGTIMDPATTRYVGCGQNDPVTGLPGPACTGSQANGTAVSTVRDPFYTGSVVGVTNYTTVPFTNLDQIPSGRIDPNAVKLLDLYPAPIKSGQFINNWYAPRNYHITINQYDLRIDSRINENNIVWAVWDVYDALEDQPGILTGVAQGANYGAGTDWSPHSALAGSYTHILNPTLTNVFRAGWQDAKDYNIPPYGNVSGIPAQYGIQGVPGGTALGGLPNIGISNLASLGVSGYNPVSHSTPNWEIDEVLTKLPWEPHVQHGVSAHRHPVAFAAADRGRRAACIQRSILGYHYERHRLYGGGGYAAGSFGFVFFQPRVL